MGKFSAKVGNLNVSIRVTPFFKTRAEVMVHAAKNEISYEFIDVTANWEEHVQWNTDRKGNYADCPVANDYISKFEGIDDEGFAVYSPVSLGF